MRKCLFVLLSSLATAGAQSTFGAISGAVTDASGAVVPGARLELLDRDEGTTRATVSSAAGWYQFLNLKGGVYRILAVKEGFDAAGAPEVELRSRQSLRLDIRLEVAAERMTIDVVAPLPAGSDDATLSDSKSFDEIGRLPLNYRGAGLSPLAALFVFPGVQADQGPGFSVGGGRTVQVEFSIDGITSINPRRSAPGGQLYPSSEMLSEFNVSQANLGAEHGRMSDATMVTKAGGNTPHASAFWYHQNAALDAKAWDAPEKPARVYHTAGGSISGPVRIPGLYNGRNRTFFFADFELHRHPDPSFGVASVPTAAMRGGDLGELPGAVDPSTGQPFPGDRIPASRINAVATRLLQRYYPLPNHPEAGISENYQQVILNRSDANRYDVRIDQYVSSRQQLFARWSAGSFPSVSGYDPLLPASDLETHTQALVVSHTYTPGPGVSNEFRFGISRSASQEHFPIRGKDAVAYLGLSGLDLSRAGDSGGLPEFDFSQTTGFDNFGHGRDDSPRFGTMQWTDSLSCIRGPHTLQFGADLRRHTWHDTAHNGYNDEFGVLEFDGSLAGDSFAELLLGIPAWTSHAVLGPDLNEASLSAALFAEDHWSATRRLRVEFGLRWELDGPMRESAGNQTNFDRSSGAVIIPDNALPPSPGFLQSINACPGQAGNMPCTPVTSSSQAGLPQALRKMDFHDFAPRLGVAYRLSDRGSTVLRGGVGIYYEPLLGPLASASTAIHTSDDRTYYNQYRPGQSPLFTLPDISAGPFAASRAGSQIFMYGVDPNLRTPRAYQWNATVERQLPWLMNGRVSYIGLNSVGMPAAVDFNQVHASVEPYTALRRPFRQWQDLYSYEALGFSNYQGLQLEMSRKLRNGFFFQVSDVYSKNLGNMNAAAQGTIFFAAEVFQKVLLDRYDTRLERGNLGGSRRNRFLVTGVFPMPVGKGRRFGTDWHGVSNAMLGGWDLSTVTLLESGVYMTPWIASRFDQSNTNVAGRIGFARPDRIGDGNLPDPTPDRFWDPTAFTATPAGAGRFGNAGAGILEGPGTIAVAAGLSKDGMVSERLRVRFEATFTNIPNHPNLLPPSVRLGLPSFGKVVFGPQTGENSGNRRGQLGIRFDF